MSLYKAGFVCSCFPSWHSTTLGLTRFLYSLSSWITFIIKLDTECLVCLITGTRDRLFSKHHLWVLVMMMMHAKCVDQVIPIHCISSNTMTYSIALRTWSCNRTVRTNPFIFMHTRIKLYKLLLVYSLWLLFSLWYLLYTFVHKRSPNGKWCLTTYFRFCLKILLMCTLMHFIWKWHYWNYTNELFFIVKFIWICKLGWHCNNKMCFSSLNISSDGHVIYFVS